MNDNPTMFQFSARESLRTVDKEVQQGQRLSVIPLDAIKNASRKNGTPRLLGSMVWTPSRMLALQSLVPLKRLQLLRRKNLARLRQDFKRRFARSVTTT
jgi:hypothetical protein